MIKPHSRNGASFAGLKIGILGGSFNPAHDGHIEMSLYALKHMNLDQVWWLVSPQNPLKSSWDMAPLSKRFLSAVHHAIHPRFIVTTLEAELRTRYTTDTLRALQKRFSRTRFVWLMGADNLRQIPRWQRWRDIFNLLPVAVFRRPSYPAGRGMGMAAIRFDKAWMPAPEGRKMALLPRKRLPAWIVLDNKLNYSSATRIRKENPSWQP